MSNETSPTPEKVESLSTDQGNTVNPEEGLLAIAQDLLGDTEEVSHDVSDQAVNELIGSEESSEEAEMLTEESAEEEITEDAEEELEDEELTDEESDEDDTEEETDEDPEEDTSELEMFDYEEIKDGLIPVKINGEVQGMTISQIQSQLGQLGAASKKSREATARLEELNDREAQLEQQASTLRAQAEAAAITPEITEKVGRIQLLDAQYKRAAADGDSGKALQIQEAMKRESEALTELQGKHQEATELAKSQHLAHQEALLKEKGYGDLLGDDEQMTAFSDYVYSNLSDAGQYAVNMDATLFEIVEKARRYDESLAKAKTIKKKSAPKKTGKTLKSGNNKTTVPSARKQAAAKARAEMTPEQGLEAIARDLLGVE